MLRVPEQTTAKEREQVNALSKLEKRFLSRRCCGLCDHPLDQAGCSAIYEACPEELRMDRRTRCLKTYKPRRRS
jgi:hypothetical protein